MNIATKKPTARESFFELNTLECLKEHRGGLGKARQCPWFQIIWVTGGEGELHVDLEKYPMGGQMFYVIPPGRMQQWRCLDALRGYLVMFDVDFLHLRAAGPGKELLTDYSRTTHLSLREEGTQDMLANVLEEMIREYDNQQAMRFEVLGGLLNLFLIYLVRLTVPVERRFASSKKIDLFQSFYSTVDKNFLTMRFVAEYASELSVSPNYLSEVVKRVSGFSASYHIQQRMVLEAKRMAVFSDANMKLIAYQLGFEDLSHFSKFFKNVAGVNFSEFRNRNRHQTTVL